MVGNVNVYGILKTNPFHTNINGVGCMKSLHCRCQKWRISAPAGVTGSHHDDQMAGMAMRKSEKRNVVFWAKPTVCHLGELFCP